MRALLSSSMSVMFCIALSTVEALRFPLNELRKSQNIISETKDILSDVLRVNVMDQGSFEKPEFCHGLDCPAFKTLNKTKTYELREYTKSAWVSTQQMNMKYDEASGEMFLKLFQYIQGHNEKGQKIAMTAPVITRVIPGQGPACENNFTMSFFMAPKVANPPAPTDKTVFLSNLPTQKVYVSSFGGWAYEKDWISHGEDLAKNLMADNQKFDNRFFYTAGYDSPFRLLNRHNEIWFFAK